jgi:small subunit ribosomal protein S21
MPGIRVKENESFESALRRFKKKCEKAGVLADLRRHQHFEKPSERRKRKMNAAKRKNLARKVENSPLRARQRWNVRAGRCSHSPRPFRFGGKVIL